MMTIQEVLKEIENQEEEFMGKKLGDAGHIIVGFEVLKDGGGNYTVNLLGQDDYSGTPTVKQPLSEWRESRK